MLALIFKKYEARSYYESRMSLVSRNWKAIGESVLKEELVAERFGQNLMRAMRYAAKLPVDVYVKGTRENGEIQLVDHYWFMRKTPLASGPVLFCVTIAKIKYPDSPVAKYLKPRIEAKLEIWKVEKNVGLSEYEIDVIKDAVLRFNSRFNSIT